MDATTVAVDLAKDVFEVAVANHAHRVMNRKRLARRQVESFIEGLSAGTTVVMEACGTAPPFGGGAARREGSRFGGFPFNTCSPTSDATRPTAPTRRRCSKPIAALGSPPVPVKTVDQQALHALHRVRTQWQATRTGRINMMRGLLRAQGCPVPAGARTVLRGVAATVEDPACDSDCRTERTPSRARTLHRSRPTRSLLACRQRGPGGSAPPHRVGQEAIS
jgi:transposase